MRGNQQGLNVRRMQSVNDYGKVEKDHKYQFQMKDYDHLGPRQNHHDQKYHGRGKPAQSQCLLVEYQKD